MGSVLVAYSGGADSTFLLKAASAVLKKKVLAVTADSPTYPKGELVFSKKITAGLGVRHRIIRTAELKDRNFAANPVNRCYFCKKELFAKLKKLSRENKLKVVIDASNASDKNDYRPGSVAGRELKIRSPLQEAGLSKEEIRKLSKKLGLPTWDKPAQACLASRIPYGSRICAKTLARIHKAEAALKEMGFKQLRVRHYAESCRIEVPKSDIPRLTGKRRQIVDRFKKIGYNYITLDLEGYRTGSMNEVPKQ